MGEADAHARRVAKVRQHHLVLRAHQLLEECLRRPLHVGQAQRHRGRGVDRQRHVDRQVGDLGEAVEPLLVAFLEDAEVARREAAHRPPLAVDHRRVELHQVDVDLVAVRRVEQHRVLGAGAVGEVGDGAQHRRVGAGKSRRS